MATPQTQLANHFIFMKALRDWLKVQSFHGVAEDKILIKKHPRKRDNSYVPGMFLCPYTERVRPRGAAGDWFGWGVSVTSVTAPSNQNLTDEEQINLVLLWRQKMYACLLPLTDVPLPGCDFLSNIEVDPGILFDPGGFEAMFDISQIIVWGSGVVNRGTDQT